MARIIITTPEQIQFSYECAGAGSRFLALFIDGVIKWAALLVIWIILYVISMQFNITLPAFLIPSVSLSTLLLGGLAGFIMIGYHVFFEALWNGQTPGKRLVGLRVIKDGGLPITIFDAAARNFLRTVDFLPSFYILGGLLVHFHRSKKRIGDMVAGTIVVKVERDAPAISLPDMELEKPSFPFDISMVGEKEHYLARSFLIRRNELASAVRARLASRIAAALIRKLGLKESPFSGEEELIEWIALEYREKSRYSEKEGS